ncbi:HNH endonuclease signature motif containing protein [Streptomyces sp. NPDC046925]|uniref:HNH endonuclease signature motif containing protein n=1 Tax=Streptomyces sp. NPDC046925 TaxID=3155375 RepID=UPI0033D291B1
MVPGWGGCWIYTGRIREDGYADIRDAATDRTTMAHRVTYEAFIGPIPEGLQLDHLCRNRRCVFPWHLEPVTARENLRRTPTSWVARFGERDHCDKGHELTPENTQFGHRFRNGRKVVYRICATCKRAYYKAWRASRKPKEPS